MFHSPSKNTDDHRIPSNERNDRTSAEDQFGFASLADDRVIILIIPIDTVHLTDSDEIDTEMKEMMTLSEEIQSTGTETLRNIETEQSGTKNEEKDLSQMTHERRIHRRSG